MGNKICVNCFAPLADSSVCPKCGFDNAAYQPQPHHLPPGTVLRNRYTVGKVLGQGGFGITYAGFDTSLDRRVAIKEYFPEGTAIREAAQTSCVSCYASEAFQKRYDDGIVRCMNEAKSLARLDDIPGIVRVLDYFQENNTAYVIMEFVEGVTLASCLKQLPQKPGYREALELLAPVGAALGEVHSRGFVHRDVSPDNIMIDRKSRAKLLDFGAVKTVTEGGTPTETPIVKRGFSPPEMYSVKGKIGPWSDVYAYCATLFYILTGTAPEEPIDRAEEDTADENLSRVASPAQTAALLKGLAIQPDQRYRTAEEMTAALTACQNDPAPERKTEPAETPLPETEVIARSAPEKTEPVPMPEETEPVVPETAVKTVPLTSAIEKTAAPTGSRSEPTAQKTEIRMENKAPSIPAYNLMPTQPAPKKKPVVLIAVLTALVALGVAIGIYIGKSSGKVSVDTSTAAPVTQTPATTPITAIDQMPTTTEPQTAASLDPLIIESFRSADIGDYVKFGTYEQDNDTSNGKEDIEWLVLAKENGKALLISRYGLDSQVYHRSETYISWENCTLRTWLNETFLNSAFSNAEQGRIINSTVTADKNPDHDSSPGNNTTDKIFLLSISEANRYFSTDNARQCEPTKYAKKHGAWTYDNGCGWWWLRSPGSQSRYAAFVNSTGPVSNGGCSVNHALSTVRPALWIDLDS